MEKELEKEILERLEQVKTQRTRLAVTVGVLQDALERIFNMGDFQNPGYEIAREALGIDTGSQPVAKEKE